MGRKRNSSYPVNAEFSRRPGLYKKIVRFGGLDPELVYGDEMESLPKKSWSPRPAGRDDRSGEKGRGAAKNKALPSFLYVSDLFYAPIFTLVSFHAS